MNINWKLRFQNKATLLALIPVVLTVVYQGLALVGITPGISQGEVANWLVELVGLAALLGIVVDPTTAGVSDSQRAMTYETPKEEDETHG